MDDFENLKNLILNGQPVRISTGLTTFSTIASVVVIALVILFVGPPMFQAATQTPKASTIIAFLLMLILAFLMIYQLIFAAHADITGKELYLKKVIGPEYEINVDQVEKISSFRLRGTIYTNIRFKDNMGITHKALILNSNSLFFGRDVPAGILIKVAQGMS